MQLDCYFFSGNSSGLREDRDLVVSISTSYPLSVQNSSPLVVQAGTRDIGKKNHSLLTTHLICREDMLNSFRIAGEMESDEL
jgi:hypothetical protein